MFADVAGIQAGTEGGRSVVGERESEAITFENAYSLDTTDVAQAIPPSRIYQIVQFCCRFPAS